MGCIDPQLDYGLSIEKQTFAWLTSQPYVVGLHATSRADMKWPEAHWIQLRAKVGVRLNLVLPWGSTEEQQRRSVWQMPCPTRLLRHD